ncbi:methyltransferase domain-containing protein [Mesorhizobium sp. IMUNJ 23232]|uniref:methyltransferase domain-containing protein n=1 Tax=Mesorhizobium sp. IMUNJ 23232 TaxID=3376064 RepID=UPI00378C0689
MQNGTLAGKSIRAWLNGLYGVDSLSIEPFQHAAIVLDRLTQLKVVKACAPSGTLSLEFGVYTGGSLRALALDYKDCAFTGFDSFKGLPESWKRSDASTYETGHFALKALPVMPPNVSLVPGFFEETLRPWLAENPGPVGFIHMDADLYSAAKYVLSELTDRIVDGAVIVFDEIGDWKGAGVYPCWADGEWKALSEWLADTGFTFRLLSRSDRFEAAIQVFRRKPKLRSSADDLRYATFLWKYGATDAAVALLAEAVRDKPNWLGGAHRLAVWQGRLRRDEEAWRTIEQIWETAQRMPDNDQALDLMRLKADLLLRKGQLQDAYEEIRLFRRKRPNHLGGVTLYAVIANRLRKHEDSHKAWRDASHISGKVEHREKAAEQLTLSEIRPEFRTMKFSGLMIQHLVDAREFSTVLDIGSGAGEQADSLRRHGKIVTELDYGESHYFKMKEDGSAVVRGDFLALAFSEQFDCVIASHVLEHQLNVNAFLRKVNDVVREGGCVAISVPPLKHQIVGGHVTLWNAGLVLYNLVLAGFDCREPWIRQYGYNISVVVRKRRIEPAGLVFDNGDIDRISEFLPPGFGEGFNGDIRRLG